MEMNRSFTKGPILRVLLKFALPVLAALFLQALYGAVDLLVVGQFGTAADVSAVATSSQLLQLVTLITTGLAMGITISIGHAVGSNRADRAGKAVGSGTVLFLIYSVILTFLLLVLAAQLLQLMKTPGPAFRQACSYVRICGAGAVFIVFYNVLGSILRGIGDSKTPLMVVACAAALNTAGDLLLVGVLRMGASGAALATVLAQAVSVVFCLLVLRKKGLPFPVHRSDFRPDSQITQHILRLGFPIALQDGLVNISFLVINAIVNTMGVYPSAGVGIAEKVCAFIMLVPSAFSQSLSAFVAQNIGAGESARALHSMKIGMRLSITAGVVLAYLAFFHGNMLAGIFSPDHAVIVQAASYLKAYAIDTLMTSFLFCFIGYFNGCGRTRFVMIQGIAGAFGVRIPVSYLISRLPGATLFRIGLATPASTVLQLILCTVYLWHMRQKETAQE